MQQHFKNLLSKNTEIQQNGLMSTIEIHKQCCHFLIIQHAKFPVNKFCNQASFLMGLLSALREKFSNHIVPI